MLTPRSLLSPPLRPCLALLAVMVWMTFIGTSGIEAQTPIPLSPPFQVNTFTSADQLDSAIEMDANGDFVVVWTSQQGNNGDNYDYSIQAQRYASDGTPIGGEMLINSYTTSTQDEPAIAMQANGDFLVVWRSLGSPGDDNDAFSIQGRHFASDGTPFGSQFQINTYTTGFQRSPQVAADDQDRFIVVWEGQENTPEGAIQGRQLDANAQPLGASFLISAPSIDQKNRADVAAEPGGGFVVVWENDGVYGGGDSSRESIQARRYDSIGMPLGPQFLVNTYTTGRQRRPSVDALANGEFIIAWDSERNTNGDLDGTGVQAQRFDSNGMRLGNTFLVNSVTTGLQNNATVQYGDNGDFIVAWEGYFPAGGPLWRLQGRRFEASGAPMGNDFAISSGDTLFIREPSIAVDFEGNFVVTWQSFPVLNDASGYGILGRRFCGPQCVFRDSFESGDTGSWSNAAGN